MILTFSQLARFMDKHGFKELKSLHQAVADDPSWFWGEMEKEVGLTWFQPYSQVMDTSQGIPWTKWYVNGKMNLTYDALDKHAQGESATKPALIWEGDGGENRRVTYSELYKTVNRFAYGLKSLGVKKGDRVVMYLPMIPETAVVLLGTAKIGAIVIPVFSGYGAEAVATRVNDSQAKVMVTADGFFRRGKRVDMFHEAKRAAALSPSLTHLVVVDRTGALEIDQSQSSPLLVGYDLLLNQQSDEMKAEPMDSEDPFLLIYTSGTTGKPKGTVHVHAGFPFKAAQDMMFSFDFAKDDILFWITDMGWMMGPWMVYGALLLGGTVLLFEGTPDYPQPDRMWSLVEKHKVTHLGVSPTAIRSLMTHGTSWVEKHDLSSLKVFGSTGEPWNPTPWEWLYEQAGKGKCPIINYSGGTEISGGIIGCFPGLPQKPCSFHGPIPGMVVDVVNEEGESVRGEVGELVIKQPWPGMTRGFWQDPERYEKTYWNKWPNVWVHGDWARIDDEGFWYIEGRSDDTLKIAGKRVGPAELESILVSHPVVVEAAVVGVPDEVKGTSAVGFVVPRWDECSDEMEEKLEGELMELVAQNLGKPLKPKAIHFVHELPRTRNGKILRRVIRSAYLGKEAGDLSSLENPQAVQRIKEINAGN
ncbi:AMP-binding protein [Microaerobacter geothermalis]|uniref:AMP-binding protein n=1 Tax=Microaerobacter geothermalis TaxID=674972 RepID=UPI001F17F14E|nr:AMP-binding protein [Microaerobacter geothermalis]MCF6093698.1 AMP-binding protein [Microaerobacter geothermalis]